MPSSGKKARHNLMAFKSDTMLLARIKKQPKGSGKEKLKQNTKQLPRFIREMDEKFLMHENLRELQRILDAQDELIYAIDNGYMNQQCEHEECTTHNTCKLNKLDGRIVREMIAAKFSDKYGATATAAARGSSLRRAAATVTSLSKNVSATPTESFEKEAATEANLLQKDKTSNIFFTTVARSAEKIFIRSISTIKQNSVFKFLHRTIFGPSPSNTSGFYVDNSGVYINITENINMLQGRWRDMSESDVFYDIHVEMAIALAFFALVALMCLIYCTGCNCLMMRSLAGMVWQSILQKQLTILRKAFNMFRSFNKDVNLKH